VLGGLGTDHPLERKRVEDAQEPRGPGSAAGERLPDLYDPAAVAALDQGLGEGKLGLPPPAQPVGDAYGFDGGLVREAGLAQKVDAPERPGDGRTAGDIRIRFARERRRPEGFSKLLRRDPPVVAGAVDGSRARLAAAERHGGSDSGQPCSAKPSA
jgi:hypothetical protein